MTAKNNVTNTIFEDTLQYLIFCDTESLSKFCWDEKCLEINKYVETLAADYIWHRDGFQVCRPVTKSSDLPEHLIGITCFGDNIEDEWFIVYLLLELSKEFHELIIQVSDCDGDFLLIEAADHLPAWANPQTTENRVFIYNGNVHIVPPSLIHEDNDVSIEESINLISKNSEVTIAVPQIQQAILKRIGIYPDKINENIHNAVVNLPLDVAALLTLKPSLISTLVTTYCHHDAIDAKYCRDLNYGNIIPVKIRFTKCLYAMLMHSKLIQFRKNQHKSNDKKITLGYKLTSGYQIIVKQNSGDIFTTKQFDMFKSSLLKNGYFQDNIEGSKGYNNLLRTAKEYFKNIECPNNISAYDSITKVMASEEFHNVKASLQNRDRTIDLTEDSDDWLTLDPTDLNHMLESRYGTQIKEKLRPETMSSQLTNFLQQTSDFEGIEPAERDDYKDNNEIEFDSNEFINSLQKMLNLISNNEEPELDSDMYSDTDDDMHDEMDREVKNKLINNECLEDKQNILHNLVQSVKEEGGTIGPASNLLNSIGIRKEDILDSDDDE